MYHRRFTDEREQTIYALVSRGSLECYIGRTIDAKRRQREHLRGRDAITGGWVSRLGEDAKPDFLTLETIEAGFEAGRRGMDVEWAWKYATRLCGWTVIGMPDDLSRAWPSTVEAAWRRAHQWRSTMRA